MSTGRCLASPEKDNVGLSVDNYSFSGKPNKCIPSFPVEPLKIPHREKPKWVKWGPVVFAPLEIIRKNPNGNDLYAIRPPGCQAVHCPVCKALVSVGQSYHDHTFFCKGGSR